MAAPAPKSRSALRASWEALDRAIRSWWDGDLQTAQEGDLLPTHQQATEHPPPQALDPENEAFSAARENHADTLLFLPHPYVTAGGSTGAFAEMYGWDTYFINLGLMAHERFELVRNHHLNQLFMIERYGMVLNGNRTYYLTRSQTPLLAEGIRRYHAQHPDRDLLCRAYPLLKQEYRHYWNADHHATPTGLATNRDLGDPNHRPALAAEAEVTDFTACFDGDVRQCNPLITNAALVKYADALAWMAETLGWPEEAVAWRSEANRRRERIRARCWNAEIGFFFDYQYMRSEQLPYWSLAGFWPLWAEIATPDEAERLVSHLDRFEHPHGLAYTPEAYPSPHPEFDWLQWGYPSGWPPMHRIVIEGLDAYGYHEAAERIATKLLILMVDQYERTGYTWEKYNVVDGSLDFPSERYDVPALHGFSAATATVLGRRLFDDGGSWS